MHVAWQEKMTCSERCKSVWTKMLILAKLLSVFIFVVQGVGSQNSINPRRSKANLTNGVPSCPKLVLGTYSKCKTTCMTDEDCENHGDDLKCCPSNPGSSCKAECKEAVLSPHGGNTCYDFENGRKYMAGDVFLKDGVCCQCHSGGIVNCSLAKPCTQGCYYGSKYYNEGDSFFASTDKCQNCSCRNGAIYCKYITNCTQDKCQYKRRIYKPGHILRLDNGCKECICQSHGWNCNAITCDAQRSMSSSGSLPRLKTAMILLQVLLSGLITS